MLSAMRHMHDAGLEFSIYGPPEWPIGVPFLTYQTIKVVTPSV